MRQTITQGGLNIYSMVFIKWKEWWHINSVIICGNLIKDNELRYTTNGKEILNNTIAIKRNYKNENNEYESDFINIKVFGSKAKYINDYAEKGSKLLIRGHIQSGSYENKEGNKVYTTDVIVDEVNIMPSNKKTTEKREIKSDETTIYMDEVNIDDVENFLD